MTKRKLRPIARATLDLNKRAWEANVNGHIVVGTWVRTEGRNWQPCMVLLHGSRPICRGKTVPCVIPLNESWRWAMHGDVGDPAHVVARVMEWLACGYLAGDPTSKRDYLAVVDAVNKRLPDLIAMPPRPKGDLDVIGEVTALNKVTGEIMFQTEVTNDV